MIKYNLKGSFTDRLFYIISKIFAISILLLILTMLVSMTREALPTFKEFGWKFLITSTWNPVKDIYSALPFIFGSVVTSIISLLIAVPLGVGTAIFLSELSPQKLKKPISFIIELLAAIPSVIYGLWGIFILVPIIKNIIQPFLQNYFGFLPIFQGRPMGVGILAAGIILAIMILPIITSITRDVLESVPDEQREAILALGATKWEMIWHTVLPYGRAGIIGAVILALGRAIGETMAVTMVIGNRNKIATSLFDLGNTMASVIANEFGEAVTNLHTGALIELGLILFVITLLLNIAARFLIQYLAYEK